MLPSQWLDKPEKWTQGCQARDKYGNEVFIADQKVCHWCAIGAINLMAIKNNDFVTCEKYCDKLCETVGPIPVWNDAKERTWEEVHAALVETERRLGLLENVNESA